MPTELVDRGPFTCQRTREEALPVTVDLGTLRISQLIAHEIPRGASGANGGGPALSDVDSPLTVELRNYFRERLVGSLASAFDVAFDPATKSPVPNLIESALIPVRPHFVQLSKDIAKHLHLSQPRVSPSGLLVVVAGHVGKNDRALAVLKLERETGIRAKQTIHDGKATFDIEHLRDLMLTERTRVFKTGFFYVDANGLVIGRVADAQQGFSPRNGVARFFLSSFLGCCMRDDPRVLTKKYLKASEEFINSAIDDAQKKTRYHIALLAEIQSEDERLSPQSFVRKHLDVKDRQSFIEHLKHSGAPITEFYKDRELIKGISARTEVTFLSGFSLIGPPSRFNEVVTITTLSDGRSHVEIEDQVTGVKGRR
jgi:hypothetical protein